MAARVDLIGRNVSFTIAPITISGGTITVGTPVAMTGKADRASQRSIRENERIEALDSTIANHVPILDDWVLQLSGIKRVSGGAGSNPVEETFFGYSYAQIVIVTPQKTWTYKGLLSEQSWEVVRGKNVDDVTLIPIDIGGTNPTYAATV